MTGERSNEDEWRALADAATPGPWGAADECGNWPGAAPAWCVSRMDGEKWLYDVFFHASQSGDGQAGRDSEFAAAARTAVPALLDALAAVRAELAEARAEWSDARDFIGYCKAENAQLATDYRRDQSKWIETRTAILSRADAADAALAAVRVERDALAEQVAALEASLREQDDRTPSALRSADYWLRQTQRVEAERDALAAEVDELRAQRNALVDRTLAAEARAAVLQTAIEAWIEDLRHRSRPDGPSPDAVGRGIANEVGAVVAAAISPPPDDLDAPERCGHCMSWREADPGDGSDVGSAPIMVCRRMEAGMCPSEHAAAAVGAVPPINEEEKP